MYSSDYGYSTDITTCSSTALYSYDTKCKDTTWLYKAGYYQNTLSPYSNPILATGVFNIYPEGKVGSSMTLNARLVLPATYLLTSIRILDGEGSIDRPFVLSK